MYPCSSSIDWVMFARLGACSARGRGGGAGTSRRTCGITCGWPPPTDAGSARRAHGTDTGP
eukprot:9364637-Alexandrium_andersonii.AAC.1